METSHRITARQRGNHRHPKWCLSFLAGWSLSSAPLLGLPGHWHSDFDAAVEQAGIAGKENLVVFTGLGWEEWSRKLHDETLAKPEFHKALREDFTLTHIDLPKTPREEESLGKEEARHYQLARDFKLHVFPAIYLCTPDGRPYGMVGYEKGGHEPLVAAIHGKRTAYAEAMRAISGLDGPECARGLDAWLQTIPEPLRALHRDKIDRIIASDPDDVTGLRTKHQLALMVPEARQLRYTGKLDESEALYFRIIDEVEPTGEDLQRIYYELGDVYFQRKDYDRLLDTLDLAIEAAPQGERMSVLREMMEVFTRQWVLTKFKPEEMLAVDHDHKRITLTPADTEGLLKQIAEAKQTAPDSMRNQVLDTMAKEHAEKDVTNKQPDS